MKKVFKAGITIIRFHLKKYIKVPSLSTQIVIKKLIPKI